MKEGIVGLYVGVNPFFLNKTCLNQLNEKFHSNVLNVFIDIQTSKELIQMDTDKMMTYGTYTMDDEKLTQS